LQLRLARAEDVPAIAAVYADNQQRFTQERIIFDEGLFRLLLQLPGADTWVVTHHGEVVAAAVALRGVEHVSLWMGFASSHALHLRPFQFIDGSLVQHYDDLGYRWYDLHPSGPRPSLDLSKKATGAEPLGVAIVRRQTAAYRAANLASRVVTRFAAARPLLDGWRPATARRSPV
jgi:hypothetical protein